MNRAIPAGGLQLVRRPWQRTVTLARRSVGAKVTHLHHNFIRDARQSVTTVVGGRKRKTGRLATRRVCSVHHVSKQHPAPTGLQRGAARRCSDSTTRERVLIAGSSQAHRSHRHPNHAASHGAPAQMPIRTRVRKTVANQLAVFVLRHFPPELLPSIPVHSCHLTLVRVHSVCHLHTLIAKIHSVSFIKTSTAQSRCGALLAYLSQSTQLLFSLTYLLLSNFHTYC